MADATLRVIKILRNTVDRLRRSDDYQWGHMGACNCGFLAQEISHLKKAEIHRRAMERYGDWNDQLNDYCSTSGFLIDDLITDLISAGFTLNDLKHLERLSDPVITDSVPKDRRPLLHNRKEDVILYIKTWSEVLEHRLNTELVNSPTQYEVLELV